MEQDYKKNSFKKLLDRLQENSWQLELLISGFAIMGLFYAIEPITNKVIVALYNDNIIFIVFYFIIKICINILIFNLLLHLLLRGMWIGSLGLRYMFGEIDFDKLNYSVLFTKHLKRKVGSFDDYIGKLENFCSVIFAITFLLIFYVLSISILGFTYAFIENAFIDSVPHWVNIGIRIPLFVLFSTGVILTFLDFITQGLLKKNKWVAKIFFPFYWIFSILTLSFLYRPLIYNFLDNKHGKLISFVLIPIYTLILIVNTLEYQKSNFITQHSTELSNNSIANGTNYEDIIEKNGNILIGKFAIQSKVITEPYVKVVVPLNNTIEDSLIEFNISLKPKKDKRGIGLPFLNLFNTNETNYDSLRNEFLNTFQKYYSFKIDTTSYKTDFVITNIDDKFSFESYIGIQDLSEGKHIIEFQSLKHKDTDSLLSIRKIPFWYYKN